jgi:thiopurine S-methyltransferase
MRPRREPTAAGRNQLPEGAFSGAALSSNPNNRSTTSTPSSTSSPAWNARLEMALNRWANILTPGAAVNRVLDGVRGGQGTGLDGGEVTQRCPLRLMAPVRRGGRRARERLRARRDERRQRPASGPCGAQGRGHSCFCDDCAIYCAGEQTPAEHERTMDVDFWMARWERGETGWHKPSANPYLVRYWGDAGVAPGARVLVPLCGKTLDMAWLAAQGHSVLGVECSPLAVSAFFAEAGLTPTVRDVGPFRVSEAGGIAIACGDVFDLEHLDMTGVAGLYDRASLIALPEDMRARYAETLCATLPAGTRGLTITIEYDQALRAGPPFSVGAPEVHARFGTRFAITQLCDDDILSENPGFVAAGIPWLREHAFSLGIKPTSGMS